MSNYKLPIPLLLVISVILSCNTQKDPDLGYAESLIPKPVSITNNNGSFALGDKTTVFTLGIEATAVIPK